LWRNTVSCSSISFPRCVAVQVDPFESKGVKPGFSLHNKRKG
jgi:hypothetical protein